MSRTDVESEWGQRDAGGSRLAHVAVGGIPIVDAAAGSVVRSAGELPSARARLVYALHVGGVLRLGEPSYETALRGADLVYADGAAVVLLARAAGARRIERAPTTDIGIPIIEEVTRRLGRPARVALVGGPPGLAEQAARAVADQTRVEIVYCSDGYFSSDEPVLHELRACRPDVVLVGMGMPREAEWTHTFRDQLPPAVIITCGGWFGFLTGLERRAPRALQSLGLEWTFRLAQNFRGLFGRYSLGALAVLQLLPGQLRARRHAAP